MTGECFCWCWSLGLAIHRCAVPACVCMYACWEYPLTPAIGSAWGHGAAAAWLVWGYWIWQPLTLFLHKPRECFLFPAFLESIHTLPTCSRLDHRRQNKLSNVSVLFQKSSKWVLLLGAFSCIAKQTLWMLPFTVVPFAFYQCTFGYIQNSTGQGLEQPTVI